MGPLYLQNGPHLIIPTPSSTDNKCRTLEIYSSIQRCNPFRYVYKNGIGVIEGCPDCVVHSDGSPGGPCYEECTVSQCALSWGPHLRDLEIWVDSIYLPILELIWSSYYHHPGPTSFNGFTIHSDGCVVNPWAQSNQMGVKSTDLV